MHKTPLTIQQVAQRTGISPSTIRRHSRLGNCPAPREYGPRSLRWDADEIEAWLLDPKAWRAAQRAKQS
jgi:excisionase family DNA binding protein